MKAKKLISLILAASFCCTAALSGCGGGDQPAQSGTDNATGTDTTGGDAKDTADAPLSDTQELIFSLNADAVTMDPVYSNTIPDQKSQSPVYEGLTKRKLDDDGNLILIPGAAASWDISEDKTVYTFHLQQEGKWSDGTPVTANDFVYSWQRAFDPAVAGPSSWQLQEMVVNADAVMKGEKPVTDLGVKAVDDYTFEVTLVKPDDNFLTVCGFAFARPVKKDLIDQYGGEYGSSAEKIMGNGPFVLKSWEPDSKMVYEPNPHYWDKENVHLTKLTKQIVKEASTLAQSLIANEIDVAALNDPDWNDMVAQAGYYNVEEVPDMSTAFFVYNCAKPNLSNPKIRLALSLGFDREKFVAEAYDGKYFPSFSMAPPISTVGDVLYSEKTGGKNEVIKALQQTYPDPKALLIEGMKEAGLGEDPSALEVHFYTLGTTETVKKAAEWLKQDIESKLGIKFIIELTEWNVMYDLVDAGAYEIAMASWVVDSGLEPLRFYKLFESVDGHYNAKKTGWNSEKSAQYDQLVAQMKEETDPDKLTELYLQGEQILLEEAAVSPIYATKTRMVVGNYITGYQVHPFLFPDFVGVAMTQK